jgi:hypothetical protein
MTGTSFPDAREEGEHQQRASGRIVRFDYWFALHTSAVVEKWPNQYSLQAYHSWHRTFLGTSLRVVNTTLVDFH